ncbi:hypothetical protein M0R45_037546 [Rubus argutus]|uniref:Uncharacterized protein n=1 Tax=Rubus argutus TaxID=59490 RepID=A0AAW1W2S4_RUBAR
MSGVDKIFCGGSDLIKRDGRGLRLSSLAWVTRSFNLDRGLSRWLGMGLWWTSALSLVCGGFDRRKVAMLMGFAWENDVVDWLGGGGVLGLIRVVGEEVGRDGSVGFDLVHIKTSATESFGVARRLGRNI